MIESFGGIIYFMKDNKPYFLVIKRQAIRGKIEWTAPKGKLTPGEKPIETAKREIFEETGIEEKYLKNKGKLGNFIIKFPESNFEKKVTYFLFEYFGDKNNLNITDKEGYIGIYSWLPIEKILNLIEYSGLRELYRKAYENIMKDL